MLAKTCAGFGIAGTDGTLEIVCVSSNGSTGLHPSLVQIQLSPVGCSGSCSLPPVISRIYSI
jgi:hypothetical protein